MHHGRRGKFLYSFTQSHPAKYEEPDMAERLQILYPSYRPPSPDELGLLVSEIARGVTKPSTEVIRPAERHCSGLVQSRLCLGRDDLGAQKLDVYKGQS